MGNIRKRISYQRWERFAEFLRTEPSQVKVMEYVHSMLDSLCAYRSEQSSQWSKESLNQVVLDTCGRCFEKLYANSNCDACSFLHSGLLRRHLDEENSIIGNE